MMRPLLIVAFMLFLGGTTAFAQQRDSTATQQEQAVPEGMTEIQASEVPTAIQEALRSANYTGWESGRFYKNESSDLYMVETGQGDERQRHYFDQNGAPAAPPQGHK